MKKLLLTTILSTILLNSNAQIPDTVNIDRLIVTGTHVSSPISSVPASVSVITRATIEENPSKSSVLSILPAYVPSLFITEKGTTGYGIYSGSGGGISIRGIGASPTTQVMVAIDGHPQLMGINGHHLPDAYRLSDAERIEVVRGPASTIYGSNAMGGVINIITRKPQEGTRTEVEASYGSYKTQKYSATNSTRKGRFSSFASVSHDQTDGHRQFSKFRQTAGNIKLGYEISKIFTLSADAALTKYRSTDPGTTMKPATTDTLTADVVRLSSSIALENKSEKLAGAVRAFYNYGDHDLYYGWHSYDHNYGVMVYQSTHLFKGNRTTAGVDIKRYGGTATDRSKPKFALDKFITEAAGYVIMEQTLAEKFTINAGLRLEHNSEYGTEWVPQAGAAYRLTSRSTVKASVAKGFRSPTIREMYVFAPTDSLRPERMVNYEISYNYLSKNNKFAAEAVIYLSDGSNIIETQFVNGIPKYSTNSGSFTNRGIELSASYMIVKGLRMSANYSYVDMKKAILGAPKQQLNAVANYSIKKFAFMASAQYVNGLYISTGASPVKENFTLVNASATYRALRWLNIYVRADNILDKEYAYALGYPMPGTTFTAGVKFSF